MQKIANNSAMEMVNSIFKNTMIVGEDTYEVIFINSMTQKDFATTLTITLSKSPFDYKDMKIENGIVVKKIVYTQSEHVTYEKVEEIYESILTEILRLGATNFINSLKESVCH